MSASAPVVPQFTAAVPANAAQGPEPRAADRNKTGGSAKRRSAQFSDLLGTLVEEKQRPARSLADGMGVAFPLLPSAPNEERVRSVGESVAGTAETPADIKTAGANAVTPVELPGVDLASAGSALATSIVESVGVPSPASEGGLSPVNEAVSCDGVPSPQREGTPSRDGRPTVVSVLLANLMPEAPVRTSDAEAAATTEDSLSLKTNRSQTMAESQAPGLETLLSTGAKDGAASARAEISLVREGRVQGKATDDLQPRISQPPTADSRREQAGQRDADALPGMEPITAAAPPASLSTPVQPGAHLAEQAAADATVVTAPVTLDSSVGSDARLGLAFAARLVPLGRPPAAVPAAAPEEEPRDPVPADPPEAGAAQTPAPAAPSISKAAKKETEDDAWDGLGGSGRTPAATVSRVPSGIAPPASVQPPALSQGESETTNQAAPPPRQTGVAEAAQEPAPAATPAREIQFQFHRGEQRVDVRLSERGGEVHVAVRTPDPQLAGALRSDLPGLSTRLEQTGFRTETWHPAIFHQSGRHAEGAPSFADSQDGGNGSRQSGQQQPEPRQPRPNAGQPATKSQRKEFRWLMSQLP